MPSDKITSLALINREHQRLNAQANALQTHTASLAFLTQLRCDWLSHLGFLNHTSDLVGALDRLIEQKQEERFATDDTYGSVIHQLRVYQRNSWQTMTHQYGDLQHLLDTRQQLRPIYQQLFERVFEPQDKLTLAQQAHLLRTLHPATSCVAVDKRQGSPRYCGAAQSALA